MITFHAREDVYIVLKNGYQELFTILQDIFTPAISSYFSDSAIFWMNHMSVFSFPSIQFKRR